MIYIKENIIAKFKESNSPPRKLRKGKKSPAIFLKKLLCIDNLLPALTIFIERPVTAIKDKIIRDIRNLFEQEEQDHYKPVRVDKFLTIIASNMKVMVIEKKHYINQKIPP